MKYIFLNIKNIFQHEKFITFIIILCVFLSSFVLNFSYGLYQNYNIKKYEENSKLDEIVVNIKKGSNITKGEFQKYIESLSNSTLFEFNSFCNSYKGIKIVKNVFYNKFWGNLEHNNLRNICFYDFRHSRIFLLVKNNFNMKIVQGYACHADYNLTANTYSYFILPYFIY